MATASPAKGAVPDWLRIQRKIFSRWVSQKVFLTRGLKVDDAVAGLGDATVLIALLEVLSEKKFEGRLEKAAKMRVHRIDNMNQALKFAKDIGVQTKVPPSAEAMVDGDEKSVLGFLWAILLKFLKIGDDSDETLNAKDALMMWAKNKTVGYANVNLENWTTSFQDGLALCAILHKHRPQLLDYASLSKENKKANLETAMNAAERYFGLEKYLAVEDFAKMDEISWVVYVSDYYYGIAEARKIDLAARRIAKLIKFTIECDNLRATYRTKAGALVQTIARAKKLLEDRTIDDTLAGAKARIAAFYEYKEGDKSTIISDKLELEGVFNLLSLKLSHNKRPEFKPDAGQTLADLEAHVRHLEQCEKERSIALHAELNRQIRLHKLADQFASRLGMYTAWADAKRQYLQTTEESLSVSAAQLQLTRLAASDREVENMAATSVAKLSAMAAELIAERFEHKADIQRQQQQQVDAVLAELQRLAAAKKPVLEADLAREVEKERLRIEFSGQATEWTRWVADTVEDLALTHFGFDLEEVAAYESTLQQSDASLRQTAGTHRAAYEATWAAMQQIGVVDNAYTALTLTDLQQSAAQLDGALAQRRDTYQAELAKQRENDALCRRFAEAANSFAEWIAATKEQISTSKSEVEQQLEAVDARIAAVGADAARLSAAGDIAQQIQARGIAHNKHTSLGQKDLEVAWAQYQSFLARKRQMIQEEVDQKRLRGLTAEQLKEIDVQFASFDKNGDKQLDRKELKACLYSLGEETPNSRLDQILAKWGSGGNSIQEAQFREFMISLLGDADTKDEVLHGFKLIARGNDHLPLDLAELVLTTHDVDYIKKTAPPAPVTNQLNYGAWTEDVYSR